MSRIVSAQHLILTDFISRKNLTDFSMCSHAQSARDSRHL